MPGEGTEDEGYIGGKNQVCSIKDLLSLKYLQSTEREVSCLHVYGRRHLRRVGKATVSTRRVRGKQGRI